MILLLDFKFLLNFLFFMRYFTDYKHFMGQITCHFLNLVSKTTFFTRYWVHLYLFLFYAVYSFGDDKTIPVPAPARCAL